MKHLKTILLMLLLTSGIIALFLPSLLAASTTMTANPSYAAEGSTVSLTLTLTGYTAGQQYNFTLQVSDPLNANSTRSKLVTIGSNGNAILSFSYPSEFSPTTNTNLNGTYAARVIFHTAPSGVPSSPVYFTVGPADRTSYQRTLTVNILTRGYIANNQATVNITQGGVPVSGFPRIRTISSAGVVSDSWKIPTSATLGNYVVSVTGNSTKSVVDSQTIRIDPAVLTVSGLSAARASGVALSILLRGNTTYAVFNVTYPDGSVVSTPSVTSDVTLLSPSSTIVTSLSSIFNSTQNRYITSSGHTFSISAPIGAYSLRVIANTTRDAFDNQGPLNNVTATFTLNRLTLITSISALKNTYNRTMTFDVNATVSYPTADSFNAASGVVFANLTAGARQVKQNLTYNVVLSNWQGSLTIPPDYPLGVATLQVSAYDRYGNAGSNQASAITVTATSLIIWQIKVNGTDFKPFQVIQLEVNATYPNNQTLTLGQGGGQITFQLPNGRIIVIQTSLQSGVLRGTYTILDTDPLGEWNLTIRTRQLNDGNANLNNEAALGPIIKIIHIQLTFDDKLIIAPGGQVITGDKFTLGVSFRYPGQSDLQNWSPNSDLVENLSVNGTVFAKGQQLNYTFTYDSTLRKYIAIIDTTDWIPDSYNITINAHVADYRGSQLIQIEVQPALFPVGPIVGGVIIVVVIALAVLQSRRIRTEPESQ